MLDKKVLMQYIDACELVRETEEEIQKIKKRRKTIVQGTVKGSLHEFPYTAKNFHVQGISYSVLASPGALEAEERFLEERKQKAEEIKVKVEEWLNTLPARMVRIIRKRVFEQKTWDEVARSIGRKATADSVRKEFERFLEEI